MDRRKLRKAWESVRLMPMPAIASDRLVDLHNDLTHYDTAIDHEMVEFVNGNNVNLRTVQVDIELEENLRGFKVKTPEEVECRRDMLKYKRSIDSVIRELLVLLEQPSTPAVSRRLM